MLPALLGLYLSSLSVWSGPPAQPVSDSAAPTTSAAAEPTPPALPEAPDGPGSTEPEVVEPEVVEPAPVEPAPVEPVPGSVLDSEAPVPVAPLDSEEAPGLEPRLRDYVRVKPPSWRGTGMMVAAGIVFVHAITFQGVDSLVVGNQASGGIERGLMAATLGLAAGGAAVRARADAYDDTALHRNRPDTRRLLVAGATMTGVGAVLGLVNEGLWWRCVIDGTGPYRTDGGDEFGFPLFDCRYGLSRGLMDLATITTGAGLGMMTWALVYRRDARAYQRARVVGLRPTMGRDRWGLTFEGRF